MTVSLEVVVVEEEVKTMILSPRYAHPPRFAFDPLLSLSLQETHSSHPLLSESLSEFSLRSESTELTHPLELAES